MDRSVVLGFREQQSWSKLALMSSYKQWRADLPQAIPDTARVQPWVSRVVISTLLLFAALQFAALQSAHAWGQEAPLVSLQKNTIHGLVLNSVTHEPVGHALVFSPDSRFATLTDDQGHFEFALPESPAAPVPEMNATYSIDGASYIGASYSNFPGMLFARKPGFLGLERYPWMLNQTPVVTDKEVTIALVPEARILGRVVFSGSNGSDRIPVQLYRRTIIEGRAHWNYAEGVTARSNGDFRFAGLEPGSYKLFTGELMDRDPLTFDPRGPVFGYPPVYFPNASDFETAGTIQLTPGMSLQAELSPVRQPYYPVKVPVTNASTDDQLQVSVSVRGRKGPGFALGYNGREQRIEGALPNGIYVIEATSQGRKASSGSVSISVKGGAVEGPSMTLVSYSSVRIEAKTEFRAKVETDAQNENTGQEVSGEGQSRRQFGEQNFSVRLQPADEFTSQDFPFGPSSTTGHDNTLIFAGVPPGRYWVQIDPVQGFAAAVTSGEIDLLRRPLTVGPGSNLVIHVTLRDDAGEISGTLEDPDGGAMAAENSPAPEPGSVMGRLLSGQLRAFVYCIPLPDSTGQVRQETVRGDGKFNLQVPPGAYRVLAFDRMPMELEFHNSEAMRAYEAKGQVVRLAPGQKENIKLQLISTSE
jgi:hypothetical protein